MSVARQLTTAIAAGRLLSVLASAEVICSSLLFLWIVNTLSSPSFQEKDLKPFDSRSPLFEIEATERSEVFLLLKM